MCNSSIKKIFSPAFWNAGNRNMESDEENSWKNTFEKAGFLGRTEIWKTCVERWRILYWNGMVLLFPAGPVAGNPGTGGSLRWMPVCFPPSLQTLWKPYAENTASFTFSMCRMAVFFYLSPKKSNGVDDVILRRTEGGELCLDRRAFRHAGWKTGRTKFRMFQIPVIIGRKQRFSIFSWCKL